MGFLWGSTRPTDIGTGSGTRLLSAREAHHWRLPTRRTRLVEVDDPVSEGVTPTDDGRYVVIAGRRWRATDPLIPEYEAAQLRKVLMSARRDVGTAVRHHDAVAERAARDRVQIAKVALGERGTPWWEQSEEERILRWKNVLEIDPSEGPTRDDA